MSWASKQLEKNKLHKMIKQAMDSPEYKKAREQDMQQATLRALTRFCFISLLYLEYNFRCKKKGFKKFLDYAIGNVDDIGNDMEFIEDCQKYYKEKYELDVMEYLGMAIVKNNDFVKEVSKELENETH